MYEGVAVNVIGFTGDRVDLGVIKGYSLTTNSKWKFQDAEAAVRIEKLLRPDN